jgi:hypothetical protein
VIALLAAVVITAPGASSYCSPSGDLCYGVVRRRGAIVLRIDTIERYFARYTLCVRPPRYRVTWRLGGSPLGPSLAFTR